MIKKTVAYTNFNDEKVTRDLYFNLSKTEIVQYQIAGGDSMLDRLERMQEEQDKLKIYETLKLIIKSAYGERSEDGEYFNKSPEIGERFVHSAAFDELIYQMMLKPEELVDFVFLLIPQEIRDRLEAEGKMPSKDDIVSQAKDAMKTDKKPAVPQDRKPKKTSPKK